MKSCIDGLTTRAHGQDGLWVRAICYLTKADLTSWWAGGRTGGRGGHVCGRGVTGAGPRGRTGGRGGHRRETRADAGGCPPAGEVSLTADVNSNPLPAG